MSTSVALEPCHDRGRQRTRTVLLAEIRRSLRQGGLRAGLLVAAIAGLSLGALSILLIEYLAEGQPIAQINVTVPVEASTSAAAVFLSIAVVVHAGRNMQNGAVQTSLALVPYRPRLLAAQFLATAILGLAVTAASSTLVALAALAASRSTAGLTPAVIGVISGSLATALMALLALSVAMLVGRAISAVLLVVAWWILTPLALAAAGQMLPSPLGAVATKAADWTPIALQIRASTVSSLATLGPSSLLQGIAALLLLTTTLGTAAYVAVNRRDF